jgi:hypothetical protein
MEVRHRCRNAILQDTRYHLLRRDIGYPCHCGLLWPSLYDVGVHYTLGQCKERPMTRLETHLFFCEAALTLDNIVDERSVQLFQPDKVHAAENSNPTVPEASAHAATSTRTLRSSTLAQAFRITQQTLFDTAFFAERGSDNMGLCLQGYTYHEDLRRR